MNSTFPFNDGIDWVKQFWGGFSGGNAMPNIMTPTLDVNELEQRINDLKTVEHWLNVNLNLLRATIQAMEVQRGTLATLQSFGANLASQHTPANPDAVPASTTPTASAKPTSKKRTQASEKSAQTANDATLNPSAWWDLLQQQFQQMAQQVLQEPSPVAPAPAKHAAAQKTEATPTRRNKTSAPATPRRTVHKKAG